MRDTVKVETPPASWAAVAAIGVGAFALVTTEFLPIGLLPQISQALSISAGQTGLMVTTPGVVAAIAAPLALGFAGKLDRRHVLCALLALLALSNLAVALADSFAMLMVGRVLLGIAVGGFWTIAGALGPRLRPGPEGGRATSLIFSGISLGTVAGMPAGTLIGGMLGWRTAFGLATAVALLVMLALVALLPSIRLAAGKGLAEIPVVLRMGKVRVGVLAIILVFIGQFSAYTYITPFLVQQSGVPAAAISAVLFGFGALGFIGNLVGGWAISRNVQWAFVAAVLMLALPMLMLLAFAGNVPLSILLVMVWGLGFGLLPIVIQGWLFSAAPAHLESVSALFVATGQAALAGGALVGGLSVDHFGLASAMGIGAAFALATAMLVGASGRPAPPA
ncbi:MFS transporter [Pseudoduganella sp. FT55W]|uniref:MFS transporter n=1 Tax=Duganella rivi TaxID=2666083 RepID=A0A7X4KAL2_9BURK|nr:MFS transporter [Duganella rivi]MYM65393.1 MFS transporter [Duganella rivi]